MVDKGQAVLLKKKVLRALAMPMIPFAQTGKLPRYRVRIPDDAKDLLVGQTLKDNYYVLSILGHGGMSVVYKGKMRSRKRIVAIKTLRVAGVGDDLIVKRFQREAELLLHLNHPRIVQVHEHGYTSRGQPYFVMDYLTGRNLSDVIRKNGPLPPDRVRHIFSQVCGAVDHAHRCGVIHRDLKPGNIMLLKQDGDRDFVKVVDFGIARFQEEAQRLTRLGEVWGSPIYMSPEQCMGAQLDVRSDIYSVGIALYESLTGQVPFLGKNYVDTMSKQIGEAPRPLSEVVPGISVPPNLEQVVMKALAKEPENRYQTMAELREDLENAFAKPAQSRQKQQKTSQQNIASQKQSSGRVQRTSKTDIPKSKTPRNTGQNISAPPAGQVMSKPPAQIAGTRSAVREKLDRQQRRADLISTVITAVIIFGLLMTVFVLALRWFSTVQDANNQTTQIGR